MAITALIVVFGLIPQAPAMAAAERPPSTDGERAAAMLTPSIVFLEQDWKAYVRVPGQGTNMYFENGWVDFNSDRQYDAIEWSTRCTGFVVNPEGYVATAGHCVDTGTEGAKGTAVDIVVQDLVEIGVLDEGEAAVVAETGRQTWRVEGTDAGSPRTAPSRCTCRRRQAA